MVVATPASATITECSGTRGYAGATLSFVPNSPWYGLQGPVRMTLDMGASGETTARKMNVAMNIGPRAASGLPLPSTTSLSL